MTQGLDSELIELGNMGIVDGELDGLGDSKEGLERSQGIAKFVG